MPAVPSDRLTERVLQMLADQHERAAEAQQALSE